MVDNKMMSVVGLNEKPRHRVPANYLFGWREHLSTEIHLFFFFTDLDMFGWRENRGKMIERREWVNRG